MASLRGVLEACSRAVRTIFFMLSMLGSLLVPSVIVGIIDVGVPGLLLSTVLRSSLKAINLRHYSFSSSLVDILTLSALRSFCLIAVYAFGGARCAAYFLFALLFGLVSVPFSTVKACLHVSTGTSPSSSWAAGLLFFSSITCALGHVVIAYRTSCQAKRKFLRGDEELSFLCKYTTKHKLKRCKRAAAFGKVKDEEHPMSLTDTNSQFMLCNGLHLHYKILEGRPSVNQKENENPNRWQLTRSGSWSFPSTRSSKEPASDLMSSLRTPLLTVSRQSSVTFPSKVSASEADSRGWTDQKPLFPDIESPRHSVHVNPLLGGRGAVLVHGFGGGVFSWRHIMGPLSMQSGYNVASFDRPGWGLTTRPNVDTKETLPNPYDLESQVDLLMSFCQKLGFRSVVLVGHDDGGLLALMTAAKASQQAAPVQVKGVVLIGVSLSREIVPAFARVLLHTSLGRHMLRPLLCSDVASRHAWHDASKLTSQVMDLYKVPLHVQGWDRAFVDSLQSHVPSELLQKVQNLPVLLVAGMQDMLVPLQAVESLASQLSKSKLVAIPRCGHLPPEECPGALLAALVPFVTELFGC